MPKKKAKRLPKKQSINKTIKKLPSKKKTVKKILSKSKPKKNVARKKIRKIVRRKRGNSVRNTKTRRTTGKIKNKSIPVVRKVVKKGKRQKLQKRKGKRPSTIRTTPKGKGSKNNTKRTRKKTVKKLGRKKTSEKTTEITTRKMPGKDNAGNIIALIGNSIEIDLSAYRTFKEKINAIRLWSGKPLQWFIDRYQMLPRAFQIILRTFKKGKGNTPHERANRMSPFEMSVNVDNIKSLILEYMVAYQDNFIEYIESNETGEQLDSDWVYNPAMIKAVIVRFFYPQ